MVQSGRKVSVAKFYLRTEGCGQGDVNLQAQIHLFLDKLSFIFWLYSPLEDRTAVKSDGGSNAWLFPCAL